MTNVNDEYRVLINNLYSTTVQQVKQFSGHIGCPNPGARCAALGTVSTLLSSARITINQSEYRNPEFYEKLDRLIAYIDHRIDDTMDPKAPGIPGKILEEMEELKEMGLESLVD